MDWLKRNKWLIMGIILAFMDMRVCISFWQNDRRKEFFENLDASYSEYQKAQSENGVTGDTDDTVETEAESFFSE